MKRGIRNKNWNYGGRNWKLSRSKIDFFIECQRCFYLDNKLGIRRPSMPSFLINSAVDALLKKEFDVHRKNQAPHPLFEQLGIDAVPYDHKNIDTWRENFEGVIVRHQPTEMTISGAIDDLWQLSDGTIAVVDYKSTAKDELNMDSKWIQNYYRQLEVYQWLLRNNDVNVSPIGFILYANGDLSQPGFNGVVKFKMSLHEHEGQTDWIEPILQQIKSTLDSDEIPNSSPECEHCGYRDMQENLAVASLKKSEAKNETTSLPTKPKVVKAETRKPIAIPVKVSQKPKPEIFRTKNLFE